MGTAKRFIKALLEIGSENGSGEESPTGNGQSYDGRDQLDWNV